MIGCKSRAAPTAPSRSAAANAEPSLPASAMEILRAQQLEKSYMGRKVFNGVSLEIRQGEVIGLLGPNGAGKTTTFRMIVGLIAPDAGAVRLNEKDITGEPMYRRARMGISYLPQEPSVFRKLTVEENILAILQTLPLSRRERKERLDELITDLGLHTVRRSEGYQLSGGERRRVEIARSLVISPSFLLLDEPFSGIDPKQVIELQSIIGRLRAGGIGIIITDHNVRETLSVTDRAFIIHNGEVFRSGSPHDLQGDPEVRRVYLGDHFELPSVMVRRTR
jgi:lipopolysaccharide export system ATP-binding protein